MKNRFAFSLLVLLAFGCQDQTIDTSDLSRQCDSDEDCVARVEIPCYDCILCEATVLSVDAVDEYERRLEEAQESCPVRITEPQCGPCATDSVRREVACIAGTCTAQPSPSP